MAGMSTVTKTALTTGIALTATLVAGCGSEPLTPQSWRDIDPCTLTSETQARDTALATEPENPVAVVPDEKDSRKWCTWSAGEPGDSDPDWSVRIELSDPPPEPSLAQLDGAQVGNPYFSRELLAGERQVYVASEAAGDCRVFTLYNEASISIYVRTDALSPEIEGSETASNCDRQKPFIESVLGQVDLP